MGLSFTSDELCRLYEGLLAVEGTELSGSRDYYQEAMDETIKKKLKKLNKMAKKEEKDATTFPKASKRR